MTIQQILLMLNAWRWLIVAVAAIVTVTAALYSLSLPKTYVSSAAVVVDIKGADPVSGTTLSAQLLPGYIPTQIDIINSDRVALKVIQPENIKFATVPITGTMNTDAGSSVQLDMVEAEKMFAAIRDDTADAWLAAHPQPEVASL